jgi:16S rRNA (guanine527-N7)-methyltransferase
VVKVGAEPELETVLERSRERGFLGPGPVGDQVAHARAFAEVVGAGFGGRAVDLGAGGGVPGLALAVWYPRARWLLVESRLGRVRFLEAAVRELGLTAGTDVMHARAEDLGRDADARGQANVVVARSFGRPAVVAECAAPLLRVGGVLAVSEPPHSEGGRWPSDGLARLGLGLRRVGPRAGFGMAELVQERVCPDRYPRRPGVPARSPGF